MALTEIPVELSSTPGIADSSNATAITIDSSENTNLSGSLVIHGDADTATNAQSGSVGIMLYASGDTAYVTSTSNGNSHRYLELSAINSGTRNDNQLFLSYVDKQIGMGTNSPDDNSFGTGHGVLAVASATGSAKTAMLNLMGDGNDTDATRVSSIFFNDQSATGAGKSLAGIEAYRASNHATDPGGDLLFSTNASGGSYTEKMRIDSAGKVGIGTDDPQEKIHLHESGGSCHLRVSGLGNVNRKVQIGYDATNGPFIGGGSSGVTTLRFYVDNTTYAGAFYANGDFYTNDGTVHSLSDVRVKKDVTDLTDGLEIVKQLKPRTFKYTEASEMYNEKSKDEVRYGFVANEVEEVAPQYTATGKGKISGEEVEDLKSLSTTKMIPMLVKAIQEQQTLIETLQAEVKALKGE